MMEAGIFLKCPAMTISNPWIHEQRQMKVGTSTISLPYLGCYVDRSVITVDIMKNSERNDRSVTQLQQQSNTNQEEQT